MNGKDAAFGARVISESITELLAGLTAIWAPDFGAVFILIGTV